MERKVSVKSLLFIILLQTAFGLFAAMRGFLDPFLATVIPMFAVSSVLMLVTDFLGANYKLTWLNILLLQIGTLLQVMIGDSNHTFITCISFVLAIVCTSGIVLLKKKLSYRKFSVLGTVSIVLLYIFLILFGKEVNGTKAWIVFGNISLQVTEIAILITVCVLGTIFGAKMSEKRKIVESLIVMTINVAGLLMVREVGSLVVLLGTYLLMVYLFIENPRYVVAVFFLFLGAVTLVVVGCYGLTKIYENGTENMITKMSMEIWNKVKNRVLIYKNPWADQWGRGYQAVLSKTVISIAGPFGSNYEINIPVVASDYIFIGMVLKMGVLFSIITLVIYVGILFQQMEVFYRNNDSAEKGMVAGFAYVNILQVMVAVGGTVGLMPMTGIPLPFLASGGTHQLVVFVMLLYTIYVDRQNKEVDLCRN